MKKTTLVAIIAVVSLAVLGGLYFMGGGSSSTKDSESVNSSENNEKTFTKSDVAKHDATDDCWTIINGSVYDITTYIPRHPGGVDEIVAACGTDGTSLFTERKTSDGEKVGSGTPHSSSAAGQLEELKIGVLAN